MPAPTATGADTRAGQNTDAEPQNNGAEEPMGQYVPAGHGSTHGCSRPMSTENTPPAHSCCVPLTQNVPAGHTSISVDTIPNVASKTRMEKWPSGTMTGEPEAAGQNVSTAEHGDAVGVVDAAEQKNPALHGPVQASVDASDVEPYRPGAHAVRAPCTQ